MPTLQRLFDAGTKRPLLPKVSLKGILISPAICSLCSDRLLR